MVFCLNKLFDLHSPPKSSFSALQRSSWRPLAPLFNGARRPNGPPARASSAVSLHTHTATDRRPKLRLSSQSGQGAATGATDDPWWEDLWLCGDSTSLWEHECDRGLFAHLEDMRVGIDSELESSGYIEFGVIYKVPAESWWRHKLNFTWINMALFGRIRG